MSIQRITSRIVPVVICSTLSKQQTAQWRKGNKKAILRDARKTHEIQGDEVIITDCDGKSVHTIEPSLFKASAQVRRSGVGISKELRREFAQLKKLEKQIGKSNVANLQEAAFVRESNSYTAVFYRVQGPFWVGRIAEFPHDGLVLGKTVKAARENLKFFLRATLRQNVNRTVAIRGPSAIVERIPAN